MNNENEKDTKLEVLAGHYSETYQILKEALSKRDRFFLYMLITILLILLYMSAPEAVGELINRFLGTQAGGNGGTTTENVVEVSFIGTILWVGLLSIAHTYYQTVLHVERQWKYLYRVEDLLSKEFEGQVFIREGKYYTEHKRKFSGWTKFIFWILVPMLLTGFIGSWVYFLFWISKPRIEYLLIDGVITLSVLISTILYLLAIHRKK